MLKFWCPFKYRVYADRVDANCPIFKTLVTPTKAKVASTWISYSATPGSTEGPPSELVSGPDENADMPMSVPSDPVEEEAVPDVPEDPYLLCDSQYAAKAVRP